MKIIIYSIFLSLTITSVAQSNLEEFLVLNIPFNGEAIDETGNLNSPILVYGATLCSDKNQSPNSAYKFDGIDDYISIPHDQILNFNSSYSVSFWVKLSSDIIGEQERIIGKGLSHTGAVQNWSFTFKDDQKMDFFWEPLNDDNMVNTTETSLDSQKFYHIVGVINTEAQQTNLYVNGTSSVINTTNGYSPTSNDNNLLLGVRENYQLGGGFDNFFDGIIDDIKIYNKPLTSCEVLSLYNEGTINYPSLQELYISQNNNILSASLYANSYNWYLNGELLEGLNTNEIALSENGNYQVQAVSDECISGLSNFYILSNEELSTNKFRVYPNPSSTYVKLASNSELEIQQISLYNIGGELVQIEHSNRMIFNNTTQQGLYFLKVEFKNKEIVYKQIVIE